MNVKKLKKVAEYILAEPEGFDQDTYGSLNEDRSRCGTQCCIAGTTLLLENPRRYLRTLHVGSDTSISREAAKALGLTEEEAQELFNPAELWPEEFARRYDRTEPNTKKRARVAYDRIMHFIKTRGRE